MLSSKQGKQRLGYILGIGTNRDEGNGSGGKKIIIIRVSLKNVF